MKFIFIAKRSYLIYGPLQGTLKKSHDFLGTDNGTFFKEKDVCLSIPSKITKIDKENNIATVDTMGVERQASLELVDQPVEVGDYVLIHIGFAMNKIDEEDALASLEVYKEIIEKMEEEDRRQAILEDDACPSRG